MALWDLLDTKSARPAELADATSRSLAAGPRAGMVGAAGVLAADTTHQVVEGHYKRVLWVWRCVDAIAQAECSLPVYAWTSHDDDATRADGFDHIERLLNGPDKPNRFEEYWEFRYRLSTLLLLASRGVFVEIVRDQVTGDPAQLTILDPDAVEIVPDDAERVKAYRVRFRNRRGLIEARDLEPDRVLWLRSRPHPTDPYRQTTPLQAAGLSADTDYLARVFNKTWLGNDGRTSKLITLKTDSGMNADDVDSVKSMFGGGGPGRAGETRVVEADSVAVADVGGSPADMQYGDMLQGSKEDILKAYGVSEPFIAWAQGRTWDNAGVELTATWSLTMRWHCKAMASGFMPLVRAEGSNIGTVILAHDFSKVEVLQRAANDKADRARTNYTAEMATIDEAREAAGLKPFKVPGTQVIWTKNGPIGPDDRVTEAARELQAASRPPTPALPGVPGAAGALPPGQGTGPQQDGMAGIQRQLAAVINDRAAEQTRAPRALTAAKSRLTRSPEHKTSRQPRTRKRRPDVVDAEVVDEWVEPAHDPAVKAAERALIRELGALTRRMLGAVDGRLQSTKTRKGTRHWDPTAAEIKAGWSPNRAIAETYVVQAERWAHTELEALRAVVRSAASGAMADLRQPLELDAPAIMTASRHVSQLVNRLVGDVERGMAKRVREIQQMVRRMDREGASLDDIKQAVAAKQAALDAWTARVAQRIAQAAVQGTRKILFDRVPDSVGVATWKSKDDFRVRPEHVEADGQQVKRGKNFTVGGYSMAFPGDPRVPPHLWANCRCRVVLRRPNGEEV